jgi:hypothetical protein
MALRFTDNSANRVAFGSASDLDNLVTGTLLLTIRPSTIANAVREICSKSLTGGVNGWTVIKRGPDGAQYQCAITRATASHVVSTPAAYMQANVWTTLVWGWDLPGGGPVLYGARGAEVLSDISTSAADGSGTQTDDSASALQFGSRDGAAGGGWGGDCAYMGLWNRKFKLNEARAALINPLSVGGCLLSVRFGQNGTSQQRDESNYSHHGIVTGATWAPDPVQPRPKRRPWADVLTVATTGHPDIFRSRIFVPRQFRRAS